jgi:hypothetical protein
MPLSSSENVQGGLEIFRSRLLYLRNRFQYVLKHEKPGMEREAILDDMEQEVDVLCDSVNVLLSLKRGFGE